MIILDIDFRYPNIMLIPTIKAIELGSRKIIFAYPMHYTTLPKHTFGMKRKSKNVIIKYKFYAF